VISVDLRRGRSPASIGDTAGRASAKHPLASSTGNASASATVADAKSPHRLAARGGSSVLGYGASDPGAVVAFEDNVLSNCDFLIDGSTTGSNGTYVAGDPDFDVYAAGGVNAFVCTITFLGSDQFSFWNCMSSHADAQVLPTRISPCVAPRCSAPRSSAPARTRRPSAPGAPAPCARTSTARLATPRHRALERRRVLVPPAGGLCVRRAHDHDQCAHAAAEHGRQERADAEERGQLCARQHRRRQ